MNIRHALVPVYLSFCIILGGASAAGMLANLILQLAAVAILLMTFALRPQSSLAGPTRGLMLLVIALVALFLAQLIPLPPELWSSLPGRAPVVQGFEMLGQPLPWLALSLAPINTLASLFWLLPAFAVLAAILRYGGFRADWIAWAIVIMTTVAVVLGAIQVAGGARSPAYLYQITNPGFAVGFFSNANHMATLLLVAIPFLAAIQKEALGKRRSIRHGSGLLVVTAMALLVILIGLLINRSLAGWGLAVPVMAASAVLLLHARKPIPRWIFPLVALLGLAAVAAVLSAPMGNNLTSDEARMSAGSRFTSFSRTLDAAADYFPAGSGIGTFQDVYRTQEPPNDVDRTYMNHAHGDYFELYLETGLAGAVLVALFLLWWARRTWSLWNEPEPDAFARAATIASAAILLHSVVDYPLRTAAISAIFAACVALMAKPRSRSRARRNTETSGRHLSAD